MSELIALAPDGALESVMSLVVPMVAAGFGLVMLVHPLGLLWDVVMSVFEL